jgi:hypothetical protein
MMKTFTTLLAFLVLLPLSANAQQGHPLDGIWLGDWGPANGERNQVVVELIWRDTSLSGNINPGFPDQVTLNKATLDSANGWKVRLEGTGMDESGKAFTTVLDGALNENDLGSANRTLTGTWTQAGVTGTFHLRRE